MSQVSHNFNPINFEKPKFIEEASDLDTTRYILQIKDFRFKSELKVQ